MWYGVSVLMREESVYPPDERIWEESIILVSADSIEEARATGERMGRDAETEYANVYGKTVAWKFDCIESVFELLDDIEDLRQLSAGVEVFSRFLRASEVASLLKPFE